MNNVIPLFPQKKVALPDVSKESYFFSFVGAEFHFGGGAFTRELLKRLEQHKDEVAHAIKTDARIKREAIAKTQASDAQKQAVIQRVARIETTALDVLETLKTPNDLDAAMSDDTKSKALPLVIAATIHAGYAPFDLLRMQRDNWFMLDVPVNQFMDDLNNYFNSTEAIVVYAPK